MRTFGVVTTCNLRGWEQYGRRFVKTFKQFWPKSVQLFLYAEDFHPDVRGNVHLRKLPGWVEEFKLNNPHPSARGLINGQYNLFKDAVKFSHKVGAWTDAALKEDVDVLVVADADIVSHSEISPEWLEKLLPADHYISWLYRVNNYPECGFFLINRRDPNHSAIVRDVLNCYSTGNVTRMVQCHDCWVMQSVICDHLGHKKIKAYNLSGRYANTSHPFVNALGDKLDHLKGPRKVEGKSRMRDLVSPRPEQYWQS